MELVPRLHVLRYETVLQPEQSPGYRLHPSYSGGARPFPPSQGVDGRTVRSWRARAAEPDKWPPSAHIWLTSCSSAVGQPFYQAAAFLDHRRAVLDQFLAEHLRGTETQRREGQAIPQCALYPCGECGTFPRRQRLVAYAHEGIPLMDGERDRPNVSRWPYPR